MLDVISLGQQETRTYGDASLCLMMGFMLHHTKFWSRYTSLRVCSYVNSRDQYADEVNRLTKLLQRVRIKASIHVSAFSCHHVPLSFSLWGAVCVGME